VNPENIAITTGIAKSAQKIVDCIPRGTHLLGTSLGLIIFFSFILAVIIH